MISLALKLRLTPGHFRLLKSELTSKEGRYRTDWGDQSWSPRGDGTFAQQWRQERVCL